MKKVIDEKNVYISEVMVGKEVNDEIQGIISYIKDELQNSIVNNIPEGRKHLKSFWLHGDGLKQLLTMNPIEKHNKNDQHFIKHDTSY